MGVSGKNFRVLRAHYNYFRTPLYKFLDPPLLTTKKNSQRESKCKGCLSFFDNRCVRLIAICKYYSYNIHCYKVLSYIDAKPLSEWILDEEQQIA